MRIICLIIFLMLCRTVGADVTLGEGSAKQKNDQATDLLMEGKFAEVDQFLASWESANPEDKLRIELLKGYASKMKAVSTKEERKKIYMQEVMAQMTKAADQMKGVVEDMKQARANADKPAEPEKPLSPLDKGLLAAIKMKDSVQVSELIKQGANVNCESSYVSPLLSAIGQSDVQMVRILLEAGAFPNKKDKDNITKNSPLIEAIVNHEAKIVDMLIKYGADVHESSELRGSLLLVAIDKGNLEIVTSLIRAGVDVNKWGFRGNTALMDAVEIGNVEFVKLLLKNGAKTTMRNDKDQTALDIAKKQNNQETIELLSK